ncbi:MAG TPA: SDR family NAD(P)-dependent oxidoreductase [Bacillota bacterium]|nr:SDR family NAD(P)-dependent oxidoreductase [Bacillota bacterium]
MKKSSDHGAVLITGASTGIGAACALHLDRLGFRVFAGVRKESDGVLLKQKSSERLTPVIIDVTDPAMITAALELVRQEVGGAGLAGLVNNAGIAIVGPMEFISASELRRQLEVNIIGTLAVTQAFLPLLRIARGRIVNMSSISGRIVEPMMGPYSISKFGLEAMTDTLRLELRSQGIFVTSILPGVVQTPIWEKSINAAKEHYNRITPEGHQLYDYLFHGMVETATKMVNSGQAIQMVTHAVARALTVKRPKVHYLLGFQIKLMDGLARFVPASTLDQLILRLLGLSKAIDCSGS